MIESELDMDPSYTDVVPRGGSSAALFWAIPSLGVALEQLIRCWASSIGLTGPQCKMLLAIEEFGPSEGIPVKEIARLLQVDSSFVSAQSQCLARKGWIAKRSSQSDARIVLLSLEKSVPQRLSSILAHRDHIAAEFYRECNQERIDELLRPLLKLHASMQTALRSIDRQQETPCFVKTVWRNA